MIETVKSASAYLLTVLLAHISARYHLSADQTAALTADFGTLLAAIGGVYMHLAAYHKEPPK